MVFFVFGTGSSVFGRLAGTSAHCGSRPPGKGRLCNQLLGFALSERIPIVFCIVGFCLVRPWRPPGGSLDLARWGFLLPGVHCWHFLGAAVARGVRPVGGFCFRAVG